MTRGATQLSVTPRDVTVGGHIICNRNRDTVYLGSWDAACMRCTANPITFGDILLVLHGEWLRVCPILWQQLGRAELYITWVSCRLVLSLSQLLP